MKEWRRFDQLECETCGDGCVEVLSTITPDLCADEAYDGDAVRCNECGARGSICTDSETPLRVIWSEDPPGPSPEATAP